MTLIDAQNNAVDALSRDNSDEATIALGIAMRAVSFEKVESKIEPGKYEMNEDKTMVVISCYEGAFKFKTFKEKKTWNLFRGLLNSNN